jgi:beta-lactam-binding protein with PASTA domain
MADFSSRVLADRYELVGQPVLAAQSALQNAGFRASTVNQANATIEPGIVFDQTPPGKSLAKKGSEVKRSVSSGPPPTTSTSTTSTTTSTTSTSTTTTTTVPPSSTTAST